MGANMNTRDVIIICLTAIILISIGAFLIVNSSSAQSTILTMTSSPTLNEGDSLTLKLNDENGSAIAGERIQINLTHDDNGVTENFTLKTNSKGECKLEDLPAGNFTLNAKYPGSKKYGESKISGKLTVNKKVSVSSSSPNSQYTNTESKSNYTVDEVIDGWDPKEHEVSREPLGDGYTRIEYDDGYFRIIDQQGHIVNYGY